MLALSNTSDDLRAYIYIYIIYLDYVNIEVLSSFSLSWLCILQINNSCVQIIIIIQVFYIYIYMYVHDK